MPAVPAERLRNRKKRKANPRASSKASSKVNSKVSSKVSLKVDSKVISTDVENTQPPTPTRNLLIKRHSKQARIPTRGSALAAGYDLYRSDTGVFNYSGGLGLINGSVRRRNSSQLGGKPSLTPRFRLWSLLARMGASPHEVALVSVSRQDCSPSPHSPSTVHQPQSSASTPELVSSTPTTVASYIYCYLISETMILRVRLLVCACDIFGPFTCFLSVAEGDRIAQLIVERIYTPDVREVEVGPLFSCSGPLSNPSLGLGRDCTW